MPAEPRSPAPRRPRMAGWPSRSAATPSDAEDGPARGTEVRAGRRGVRGGAPHGSPAAGPGTQVRSPVSSLVALCAAVLILLMFAAWFRGEANQVANSVAASNRALVNTTATAQVAEQVRDAIERVYSYDYARLAENERAAREVITGPFAAGFDEQFALVRQLAPEQQAVVVAKVLDVGVKVLDGDRAILVAFVDQQASQGAEAAPLRAAGRLTVTAERVGGRWKIASVEPF